MKKYKILREKNYFGTKIALVKRDTSCQPYVVAYAMYDDGTWGQGHYFSDYEDALRFFKENYNF